VILLKICPRCQFENFISYDVCDKCGKELAEETSPPLNDNPSEINTYLTEAILTTIFCLSPIGIAAIIYAVRAKSKMKTGDMRGAIEYSDKARNWYWIALGVSLSLLILYIFIKENF
jgi:hypothetical protein